jgi:hypothetical protein
MTDKILVPVPVTEQDIADFVEKWIVYANKTYSIKVLVSMWFTVMKNNFHNTLKKYSIDKRKDVFWKSCILWSNLEKFLLKKS